MATLHLILTSAVRALRERPIFHLLLMICLAIGFTASFAVGLLVWSESNFDRFHVGSEEIYRITHEVHINDREVLAPLSPGPMAARLLELDPRIVEACRVRKNASAVRNGTTVRQEEQIYFVDPSFLSLFSYKIVDGSTAAFAAGARSVILTATTALRYFGDSPSVGETLRFGNEDLVVAAVVEDESHRSHLQFDFLVPISVLGGGDWIEKWLANNLYTYVRLAPGTAQADLDNQLAQLVERQLGPEYAASIGKPFDEFVIEGGKYTYDSQSLHAIHLHSRTDYELAPNGDFRIVRTLLLVGLGTLVLALLTYINLMTARASDRAREIGQRKAVGASRADLLGQLACESYLVVAVAASVGLALVGWWIYQSDRSGEAALLSAALTDWRVAVAFFVLTLGVGSLAAAYPALILSSFSPGVSMRNSADSRLNRTARTGLVMLQFGVTSVLVVLALAVDRQMDFVRSADLGFSPEGVISLRLSDKAAKRWGTLKEEFQRIPAVSAVSATTAIPGEALRRIYLFPSDSRKEEDIVVAVLIEADADFSRVLRLRLLSGTSYSQDQARKSSPALLSRTAQERLQRGELAGKSATIAYSSSQISGVIDDLMLDGLFSPPEPVAVRALSRPPRFLLVRLQSGEVSAREDLEEVWSRVLPDVPLSSTALEDLLAARYSSEYELLSTIRLFAMVAILLGCLSTMGLAAYGAHRRRREIAIRRAVGASVAQVSVRLLFDFVKWASLAVLLALPAGLLVSRRWLERFAYQVELSWWWAVAAGFGVILFAALAVLYQAVQGAVAQPARALNQT